MLQLFNSLILLVVYISLLITNAKVTTRAEDIKDSLSRITHYELVHFDLSSFESDNIIGFDAFNQHFLLKLRVNHDIIMGQVRHYAGTPYNPRHLNTSCHYHGTIINIDGYSSAALSMCPGRGILGYIRFANDRFEINPSRHWFGSKLSYKEDHEINDEHLIYKESDYNTTGIPIKIYGKKMVNTLKSSIQTYHKASILDNIIKTQHRRLQGSAKTVELYILSDPSFTKSSNNAESDAGDIVNKLTEYYSSGSWSIGSIRFSLSGFDAAQSWSGKFAKAQRNNDAERWADAFENYARSINFPGDAAHLITKDELNVVDEGRKVSLAGLAAFGTMCASKSGTTGVSRAWRSGTSDISETMAHEIGHHFGIEHDEDSGCGSKFIMAAGSGNSPNDWSSCSEKDLNKHCSKYSNCGCLGAGGSSNTGNTDDDNTGSNNNNNNDDYNSYGSNNNNNNNNDYNSYGSNNNNNNNDYNSYGSNNDNTGSNNNNNNDDYYGNYYGNYYGGGSDKTGSNNNNNNNNYYGYNYYGGYGGYYGGFNEAECLQENKYEERICVYNDGKIWNIDSTESTQYEFILLHSECINDRAIYYHDVFNKSYSYYLHWDAVDSWIIKKNYNDGTYGVATAWCASEGLNANECGSGQWDVRVFAGDTIRVVPDETMTVMNEACGIQITGKGMKMKDIWMLIAFAIVSSIVVIIILVALVLFVLKKKSMRGVEKVIAIELEDEEAESDEEIEISCEMDGIHETTTR